jgi:hypothetical protein
MDPTTPLASTFEVAGGAGDIAMASYGSR